MRQPPADVAAGYEAARRPTTDGCAERRRDSHGPERLPSGGASGRLSGTGVALAILAVCLSAALAAVGCRRGQATDRVVVYVAQDQVYAEPLLSRFSEETGIRAAAVFDSEAVKTVGLANRLLAERRHPQCDLFWGNEELRVRQLEAHAVWREANGWAAFGYRTRRLVINTNYVSPSVDRPSPATRPAVTERRAKPPSLRDLTNAVWRGRVALAYPLFGTTATHFLALRQHWGEAVWERWCRALAANQPLVVEGNSVVAKLVAKGEAWVGLTDSDDIAAVQKEGAPVLALPLDGESLLIPNTVAVTRGAPRMAPAERLFKFLQQRDVQAVLVAAGALEGIAPEEIGVATLEPDWARLVAELDSGTATLKEIFLR